MSTLAILTVGTQEVQSDLLAARVTERLGPEVRVQGRPLGEQLGELDDDELCMVVCDDTVRNGPCFQALDEREDGWSLALLATDQPEDVPQRVGDTIDIAQALRRWVGLTRPHVTVLAPYVITERPDLADERLAETIQQHVGDAVQQLRPTDLAVLPGGGTPAMRLLTERAAALITDLAGEVTTLVPDPSRRGEVSDTTVMRLLRRDHTHQQLASLFRETFRGGRYHAAEQHAEAMTRLGFAEGADLRSCVAETAAMFDRGDWPHRLAARIALVRRLEDHGAVGEALLHATIAAEMLPVVWARQHDIDDVRGHVECRTRPCERRDRSIAPAHMLGDPGQAPPFEVDAARGLALCALVRCRHCPLREVGPPLQRLWDDPSGARRAAWLRDAPRTRHLVAARNDYAHPDRGRHLDVSGALQQEHRDLPEGDIDPPQKLTGVEHLLRAVHRGLLGHVPPDPLADHEQAVGRLLTHPPDRSP